MLRKARLLRAEGLLRFPGCTLEQEGGLPGASKATSFPGRGRSQGGRGKIIGRRVSGGTAASLVVFCQCKVEESSSGGVVRWL